MTTAYDSQKIRALLHEGFTVAELHYFCQVVPEFQPLHQQLSSNLDELVEQIINHARAVSKFEELLTWAKKHNPTQYEAHQPYNAEALTDATEQPAATSSQQTPFSDSQREAVSAILTNPVSSPLLNQAGVKVGDVKGGIQGTTIVGGDFHHTTYRHGPVDKEEERNRRIILKRVKEFWVEGVLEKSLHGVAMLELGLVERADAIKNPFNLNLKTVAQPEQNQILPPSTHIADIFDQMDGALLILGDPGSGKTMTLLELARQTIARAENDSIQPIPIVFNLSSWSGSDKSIAGWLVEEMKAKYKIPARIGERWTKEGNLLLLLDGLDEVKPERREACVQAINEFSPEYGLKNIVVCSRIADYETLATRLKLQGAVLLQPLTSPQVDDYLERAGDQLAAVRILLEEDKVLQELTQSPLMLSIMTLAYREKSVEELRGFGSEESRRTHLFETYIDRMFNRTVRTKQDLYPREQVMNWLAWLAQQMTHHNHSVFFIEQLQPSWLSSRKQRWLYVLTSRLSNGLWIQTALLTSPLFLITWVIFYIIDLLVLSPPLNELITPSIAFLSIPFLDTMLTIGLIGLSVGIIDGFRFEQNNQGKIANTNRLNWSHFILLTLTIWVLVWLVGGQFWLLILLKSPLESLLVHGLIRMVFSLIPALIFGITFGVRGSKQTLVQDIQTVEVLSWAWVSSRKGAVTALRNAFIITLMLILLGLFCSGLVRMYADIGFDQRDNLLGLAKLTAFSEGFFRALHGYTTGDIISIVISGFVGLVVIGAIFGGLRGTVVEEKTFANQGIRLTLKNSIVGGLIASVSFALFFGIIAAFLINGFHFGLVRTLVLGTSLGLITGLLPLGLLGGLWYGGFDLIQHYSLCLILYLNKYIPWNYVRFLDYATERIFLRRVGGGYIFIHRLLQDHFVELKITPRPVNFFKVIFATLGWQTLINTLFLIGAIFILGTALPIVLLGGYITNLSLIATSNSVEGYNLQGDLSFNSGDMDQAVFYYTQAIELDSTLALSYANRGLAYNNSGNWKQAIADYTRAIELDPTSGDFYYNRGVAYANSNDWKQAIADYTKAIELDLDPTYTADVYNYRGIAYFTLGSLKEAISDYTKAIEVNPSFALAYYNRGYVYSNSNDWKQAIADYTKAIELDLDPTYAVDVYNYRGVAYSKLGNLKEAISDYTKAVEVNPSFALAYYNRGLAYATSDDWEKAIPDYDKAIELDPTSIDFYNYRGVAYFNSGNMEQAIADFSKAIEVNPNFAFAYYNRGNAYRNSDNLEQAVMDYTKAIELNPNSAGSYNSRGAAYFKLGNLKEAISDYTKAVEVNPSFALAYYNRGLAYANSGDWEQAITDYTKAIELGSISADIYNYRGIAYSNLGSLKEAISDYTKAIEANASFALAYIHRAYAYANSGNWAKAIPDYTKAIELGSISEDIYNYRGLAYFNLGYLKEAISDYTKAIEANASFALAYHNRGYTYASFNNWRQAILDYTKAIELNQNYTLAYYNRGYAHANSGNLKSAIKDYNKALELDPTLIDIYIYRGNAYADAGNSAQAIKDYKRYLELAPDTPNREEVNNAIKELEAKGKKQQ